ncbi:insulinase family protein, partial [Acinetobacter baumannii]
DAERVPLPKPGPAVSPNIPTPQTMTLGNGLKLVVVEKHDLPLVAATVLAPAGAASDPVGSAGLTKLTASLLTKGTATRSATSIARDIENLGGS